MKRLLFLIPLLLLVFLALGCHASGDKWFAQTIRSASDRTIYYDVTRNAGRPVEPEWDLAVINWEREWNTNALDKYDIDYVPDPFGTGDLHLRTGWCNAAAIACFIPNRDSNGYMVRGTEILFDSPWYEMNDQWQWAVALHEMGHAYGLDDHENIQQCTPDPETGWRL